MISAGVILDRLTFNQLSYEVISQLNMLDNLDTYIDITGFYRDYAAPIIPPKFATMHDIEAIYFKGPLIATSVKTAQMLNSCKMTNKKYLYVFNLEWTFAKYPYSFLSSIYQNDDIELIARSESHANIIEECWKKPVATIEGFNYEQIAEIITR